MSKQKFIENLKTDIRHTLVYEGKHERGLTEIEYQKVKRHLRVYQTMTSLAIQESEAKHDKLPEIAKACHDTWEVLFERERVLCDELFDMGVYKTKYDTPWKTDAIFKDEEDCDGLWACAYQHHAEVMENF